MCGLSLGTAGPGPGVVYKPNRDREVGSRDSGVKMATAQIHDTRWLFDLLGDGNEIISLTAGI